MMIGETVTVALDALRANKLRSLLTMLGIVIGVAAVIAMVALGRGAQTVGEATASPRSAHAAHGHAGPGVRHRAASRRRRPRAADARRRDRRSEERAHVRRSRCSPRCRATLQVQSATQNTNTHDRSARTPNYLDGAQVHDRRAGRMFTRSRGRGAPARRRARRAGVRRPRRRRARARSIGETMRIGGIAVRGRSACSRRRAGARLRQIPTTRC